MKSITVLPALVLLAACTASPEPRPGPPSEGQVLPEGDLVVTDMGGTKHDLDDALARGESVALVFWRTGCGACQREAPGLVEAAKANAGKLEFVGVVPGRDAVIDDALVTKTAKEWGYEGAFPQVRDRQLELTRLLGVEATPTIVVLGPGRKLLYRRHVPPESWAAYAR